MALAQELETDTASAAIFAAECSPPRVRGALVMQWQMWTAFGIMLGYVADIAFYFVSQAHPKLSARRHRAELTKWHRCPTAALNWG